MDAPRVFDGSVNGDIFRAYVERIAIPTPTPGDVVKDSLRSHKSQAGRKTIHMSEAHLLSLPPFTPDLNPVEQVFSKFIH